MLDSLAFHLSSRSYLGWLKQEPTTSITMGPASTQPSLMITCAAIVNAHVWTLMWSHECSPCEHSCGTMNAASINNKFFLSLGLWFGLKGPNHSHVKARGITEKQNNNDQVLQWRTGFTKEARDKKRIQWNCKSIYLKEFTSDDSLALDYF